jgi:oxaloacetate decarboxylase gamma subunit
VDTNLIGKGVELMLFGMGTVVVFLSLLVVVTSAMSALVRRFAPAEEIIPAPAPREKPADDVLLAVITAAIHQHRLGKKS